MSKAGLGNALLSFGQFGMKIADRKMQDQQAKELKEMALATEKQKRQAELESEPTKYQTLPYMQDGARGQITVANRWDKDANKRVEETLGFVPDKATPPVTRNVIMGEQEGTQQWNESSGAWDQVGQPGPRWNQRAGAGAGEGGDTSGIKDFNFYNSLSPEERAIYDRMKGRSDPSEDEKKDERFARAQTAAALRDFNKLSGMEKEDALKAAGIDPSDPQAFAKYRNSVRDDNLTQSGLPLFKRAQGGAATSAPAPLPSSAQASPTQPGAPSVQDLMEQATTAVKGGADQAQVEARLRQLMTQYGYQPQ